jgi:hypothetical protein
MERTHRGSAQDRHRVGRRAEPGLDHPDHRDAELGVRLRAQAGPAAGVQIGVAVDHQQAQPAQIAQDPPQRRELAPAELTRPIGRYLGGSSRVRSASTCARAALAASTAAARPRRCSGSARPRLRVHRGPGARRFPCLEDARPSPASGPCSGSCPRRSAVSGPADHEA